MLKLRSVRLQNVIRRNAVSKCRGSHVAFCSTQTTTTTPALINDESKTVPSDSKTWKKCRFEASPEQLELKFKIPGLSVREETFIKQQTRIILWPDCMKETVENEGNT